MPWRISGSKNYTGMSTDKIFIQLCQQYIEKTPETEYRFHPVRKFKFDYAFINDKLAVECEGGIYTKQAHGSITGILRDMEKYNLAASMGWRVLRFTPKQLLTFETIELIKTALRVTF